MQNLMHQGNVSCHKRGLVASVHIGVVAHKKIQINSDPSVVCWILSKSNRIVLPKKTCSTFSEADPGLGAQPVLNV